MRRSVLSVCVLIAATSLVGVTPAQARITFDIDYSLDANGFFSTSTADGVAARAALAYAADTYSDRFLDTLSDITPGGINTWTPVYANPATGGQIQIVDQFSVATNTIKVFAGGRDLDGNSIGLGGPGGYGGSGTQAFIDAVVGRGQAGALTQGSETDYGPWGGTIAFDMPTLWNFSVASTPTSGTQNDFVSVALHELGHMLGVGGAASFQHLSSGLTFTGAKATAVYGQTVPLANAGHLGTINSTVNGVATQQVAMSPSLITGTRKLLTVLDWAVFDDLGWGLARPGDADANSAVNFDDLLILAKNFNGTGKSWSEADFNYDQTVTFDDLLILAKNFNTSGPLPASIVAAGGSGFAVEWAAAQSLVPEPTSIATIGLAAIGLIRRRRAI